MSLQSKARRLRLHATETETVFWHHLRNRRLAGFKFKRQVPIGPYIVDFLCQQKSLLLSLTEASTSLSQIVSMTREERAICKLVVIRYCVFGITKH